MKPSLCTYTYIMLLAILPGACQQSSQRGILGTEHVVMIGLDGFSPDGIRNANTPVLDQLMATGAYTLRARGVMPTSSGPNWASILMGAGPEQHGVTGNSYTPLAPALPPIVSGEGERGLFPTIFEIIRTAEPQAELGAIYHWNPIANYFEAEHVTYNISPDTDDEVLETVLQYLSKSAPRYLFIHFDDADHAGHTKGHGTESYYQTIEMLDAKVGEVIKGIEAAGLRGSTLIVVTADHGGNGFGHNENIPEVINIPFILNGPGVKKGYEIHETVNIIDNAPTVAFALGIEVPAAWTGRPVKTAFEGFERSPSRFQTKVFYRKPRILPQGSGFRHAGGLYLDELPEVEIKTGIPGAEIRYTLDGSEPGITSPLYEKPFTLSASAPVKAAVFKDSEKITKSEIAYFRVVHRSAQTGTRAKLYQGNEMERLPGFQHLEEVSQFTTYEFTSEGITYPNGPDQTAVRFEAWLKIEVTGDYTFYTASDDGSNLYINNEKVVDNDGNHGVQERSGTVRLTKGYHKIEVAWFNSGGGLWLNTYFEGPGIPKQILSADRLYIEKPLKQGI